MDGFVHFLNANTGLLSLIFSALVTVATLIYAILTWHLVAETRRMRKAQTDANITVSVVITERWVNFLELLIKNEGVGPAYDIVFKVEPIDPEVCDKTILDFINELGFVKKGLAFLSPGREIRTFLTSMLQDYEKKIKTVIKLDFQRLTRQQYPTYRNNTANYAEICRTEPSFIWYPRLASTCA